MAPSPDGSARGAIAGHGEHDHADAGGNDAGPGLGAGACGDTPRQVVDYWSEVDKEMDVIGVQAPTIRVNDTDLYALVNWGGNGSGRWVEKGMLLRASLESGKVTRVVEIPANGGSQTSQGLAVSNTDVVYSRAPAAEGEDGAILRIESTGDEPVMLARTKGRRGSIVVIDDHNAYFVDDEGTKSVPLSGGPVRLLSSATPYSLGLIDGTLYLADYVDGVISAISTEGGDPAVIAGTDGAPLYPIACGSDLCWASFNGIGNGTVMRLAPGGAPVEMGGGINEPHALVFDGENFFVTGGGGGLWLYRIPAAGGLSVLAYSEIGITDLAVHGDCLYWSSALGISTWSTEAAGMAMVGP